jgi:hypothetical protein
MPNTAKGAPYPADTAIPDGPAAVQALAEHLDTRVPYARCSGVKPVVVSSGTVGTATVDFPAGMFTSTGSPIVAHLTIRSGSGALLDATTRVYTAPTTAGMGISLSNVTAYGTYDVYWTAEQDTP